MKNELKLKIENFLKNRKKDYFFNYSEIEILNKIQFKFMRDLLEESENLNDEIIRIINKIKIEKSLENLEYYSYIEFKNIYLKRLNMRIFYIRKDNDIYDLYLSFNLNDKRFSNKKYSDISKNEMIKIKNQYSRKEYQLKKEREMIL